jgi:flagellar secretion chaperone FliS
MGSASMTQPSSQYLEGSLLGNDPVELVGLLYQIALDSIDRAIAHLQNGEIMARSKAVAKAHEAVTELLLALDYEKGGDLSRRLSALYVFVQEQLLKAHAQKSEKMLRDARRVMQTLADAWSAVLAAPKPEPMEEAAVFSAQAVSPFGWQDPSALHRSSGWTL